MRDSAGLSPDFAATTPAGGYVPGDRSLDDPAYTRPVPGATAAGPHFVNVAAAAGLTFVHRHSPTPDKHYPESVPGGVAVFDYDADGRPDIFFTNGGEMPGLTKNGDAYANRLYRNEGSLKFTDVTAAAGVSGPAVRPAARRSLIAANRGSRSFSRARSGEAMKIDE